MKTTLLPALMLSLFSCLPHYGIAQILPDSQSLHQAPPDDPAISRDFHQSMRHLTEPSTVSTGLPFDRHILNGVPQKRPFIMEADSRFPIVLAGRDWYSERAGLFYSLHLIPQFQVRIFRDDPAQGDSSRSVRTPSYLPGFDFFLTHRKLWPAPQRQQSDTARRAYYFLRMRGFHHSNGQDQAEFRPDGTVNTYNGNFGEGLIFELAVGALYRSNRVTTDSIQRRRFFFRPKRFAYHRQNYGAAYWRLGYEYHPFINEIIRSNPAFDQYDLLGKNIVRLQLGYLRYARLREYALYPDGRRQLLTDQSTRERWRTVVNFAYLTDRKLNAGSIQQLEPIPLYRVSKRLNVDATLYLKTYGNQYAAWFFQVGYHGSDPYNLYFQQSVLFYRIGIAWAHFQWD